MAVSRLNDAVTITTYTLDSILQSGDFFNLNSFGFTLERLDNGKVAAVWTFDTNDGSTFDPILKSAELGTRILNSDGTGAAGVVTVDTSTSETFGLPAVVGQSDGSYLLTYGISPESDTDFGFESSSNLYRFNELGSSTGSSLIESAPTTTSGTGEYFATAVRLGNGNTLVVWGDTHDTNLVTFDVNLLGRIYDASGAPVGNSFDVSTPTTGYQFPLAAGSLADGRSLIVYSAGTLIKDAFSGVTAGGKETALKARFVDANGAPSGAEITIDTTPANAGHQQVDILSLATGGWVAVWTIDNANGTQSIQAQRYSIAGAKVGAKTTIATT